MQEMMMLFQILSFPVTGPLRTVAWIGGAIHDAVDSKMNDPMEIKRTLAALEQQLEAGSISEQEYEQMEMELIKRLQGSSQQTRPANKTSGG
jgi:Gas vesicle protein G